jgi:flagellar hook protein FlgE
VSTVAFDAEAVTTGAADITMTLDFGANTPTTQFGSAFSVNMLSQDGYTTGRMSGVNIAADGIVYARYSNGQSQPLGQVVLTNFTNPQGMRPIGDTTWTESSDSGTPLTGVPGSSSLGLLQSGALEDSNVNLTDQLVRMITTQRNFQANAQVITTEDTITQTIINIR